ncbi:GNAT family N-acetyltransferase [Roseivirga sp.]|uniref:GNAT family N-acetyltransferase n=1 Tax=Roseivirga sp. TaxID=1964215 RepID=UPI003B8C4206
MEIKRLTKASEQDAFLLSKIAQKAKAHWDYPKEWLALWRNDLTFDPAYLNAQNTFVIYHNDTEKIVGFCVIEKEEEFFVIEHCWIEPSHHGKGLGKTLLKSVLSNSEFRNQPFQVLSDPNAVGFYEKFGFKIIEMIPAQPAGRELPLMHMINNRH